MQGSFARLRTAHSSYRLHRTREQGSRKGWQSSDGALPRADGPLANRTGPADAERPHRGGERVPPAECLLEEAMSGGRDSASGERASCETGGEVR